jgi:predicted deacylase
MRALAARRLAAALMSGALWLLAAQAVAMDFGRYHTQDEINQILHDYATQSPELVTFHQLGTSEQGREISYDVVGTNAALPAIFLNGTHHGNEPSSTESILGVLDHLVTQRGSPDVAQLLAHYRIFLLPLVNPDGHAANTREDPEGRDPNRDYSYPGRSDQDSFKIGFIGLMKGLVDQVKFRAAVAYHSGMTGVLWPWCYTSEAAPDRDVFYTLSQAAATAMGMDYFVQSYDDYETEGEFIDYAYMKYKTLAVTFEVSEALRPDEADLAAVVDAAVNGTMAFMKGVEAHDAKRLALHKAPPPPPNFLNAVAIAAGKRRE